MVTIIHINAADIGHKKSPQNKVLMRQFTCDFDANTFVGVVGLNGVGKSTFLKTLAGLLPLLSGEITIANKNLKTYDEETLAKTVAIVLTEKFGGFNLRVKDVVQSGLMPYTNAFHQINADHEAMAEAAIKLCGLENYRETYIDELSDGYFQRTVIAKALAQQSPIMLMDEPSAFLDYAAKHELYGLLKNMCEQNNRCILISSHDLDLLLKYCHQLLVITEEEAVMMPVSEAKNNPAFKKIAKGFI